MKYAIISINNNQYKVSEGKELVIDKTAEKDIDLKVLLIADGDNSVIGTPYIEKAKIDMEYIGEEQGKKLHVRQFKSKSRYRRKIGFRPKHTRIKINKIKA